MAAEPSHRRFEDAGISGLESHLETVQFSQGTCLMREGSPGDKCHLIVAGEVRVEVERRKTGSRAWMWRSRWSESRERVWWAAANGRL
jgi:CRP-like cAMP-binding protein